MAFRALFARAVTLVRPALFAAPVATALRSIPNALPLIERPLVAVRHFAHMRKLKHKMAAKASRGPKGKKKYKIKTHSGSKKRFRFTKTGLVKMGHAGKRHNMYFKSPSRSRRLSRPGYVHKTLKSHLRRLMPYGRP